MAKKRSRRVGPDIKRIVAGLQVSEWVDGHTVLSLCPCHAGWEVFEQNVSVVLRLIRNGSRVSRAHALHVFDDAARIQSMDELRYYLEPGEERIGEKRASSRFRSVQDRLEARRESMVRKRKRGHRVAGDAA